MKIFKRVVFIIIGILFVLLIIARNSKTLFPDIETVYSSNFSIKKFESIKNGMSKREVDSILGSPFHFTKTEFIFDNKIDSVNNQFKYNTSYSKEKKVSFIFGGFYHFYQIQFNKDTLVIGKYSGTEYD